jgi:mono/diheme cytochrome c family protein
MLYGTANVAFALALSFAVSGYAQPSAQIKHVPAPNTDPTSGAEMYHAYCASCHGLDGKGNGPVTPALKVAPPDLTQLSRQNGGKFPDFKVSNTIQGDNVIVAHGSREMPVWGEVFRALKRDESVVKLRVYNLTQYIASLQEH